MASSDERREVAATLRDAKRKCEERGYPWMTDDLILAIGYEHDYEADNGIFDRLADLIDPTCEIATYQVDDGEWGAHEIYECCSNCGNQNMRDRFTGKPYRFCPHCGSRVVSHDDN